MVFSILCALNISYLKMIFTQTRMFSWFSSQVKYLHPFFHPVFIIYRETVLRVFLPACKAHNYHLESNCAQERLRSSLPELQRCIFDYFLEGKSGKVWQSLSPLLLSNLSINIDQVSFSVIRVIWLVIVVNIIFILQKSLALFCMKFS